MRSTSSVVRRASVLAGSCLLFATAPACRSTSTQLTAPSTGTEKCTVTVAASANEFAPEGGEGRVTITTERDCAWDVQTDASWIAITSAAEGQGSGTVVFNVTATADPVGRTASLTVAEQRLSIAQRGAPCRYRVSPGSLSLPASGGGAEVEVDATSGLCEWNVIASAGWVSVGPGGTNKGDGRVAVQVGAWSGPPRQAEIRIADERVVLSQSTGCAYAIEPVSAAVSAAAGRGAVAVRTEAGCGWSASSNQSWVTIATGAASAGPGTVEFAVTANAGPPRSATLTIAGRPFAITQASGCSYRIDPPASTFAAAGGSGSIALSTAPGCAWSAESEAGWVSVSGARSGTGPAVVPVSVSANTGPQRAAGVRIAGQGFTATQLSGCTYSIDPVSWTFPAGGHPGWITLTTAPGCPWTATSQADWMTFTGPTSGVGPGTIWFLAHPNFYADRTGTLTIAGLTFYGSQPMVR